MPPLELIVSTAITTVVGILVKGLVDTLKHYIDESAKWRKSIDERLEKQAKSIEEIAAWRKSIDERLDKQAKSLDAKLDKQADTSDTTVRAIQATMRAQLIHNAEKYFERDWITPEERASWCDMHDRYSELGANGLIETYRQKINDLPDREI